MPSLRLPIFDQSLFQQPVEQQVKTLADFIMRYRRELEYLLNGELDDENGVFKADVIISNTVITQNLYAEYGRIANLSVNELDTSWEKITNYLAGSTADVNYIHINDQNCRWITATVTDPVGTEHLTNKDGEPLYWVDNTHTGMTLNVTSFPVTVYTYDEWDKASFSFNGNDSSHVPVITLGAGFGSTTYPERGKAFIYKGTDGLTIEYFNAAGETREIRLDEDGVFITPYDLESISFSSTGFSVTYSGETYVWTWTKDGAGKITSLQIDGRTIPVTWP